MRSVCRGPWPTREDGQPLSFEQYDKAKLPLIERLGEYCSYCERVGDLHVEHVVPRSHAKELESDWENFLLGCTNCNSTKRNNNQSRNGFLWPDEDETFKAFTYRSGGRISVADGLAPDVERRARSLFELVGLGAKETDSNRRRHKRRQAWDKATAQRGRIKDANTREMAIEVALGTGFFSVWMTVFHDDEDMCRRLKQAFPGTCITSDSPEQDS